MALLFMDGAEEYNTANATRKWDAISGLTVQSSTKRTGNNALQFSVSDAGAQKNLFVNYTSLTAGAAFYLPNNVNLNMLSFWDLTTRQCFIGWDASTQRFYFSDTTATRATSTRTFAPGAWWYAVLSVTFHSSAGSARLWVNGTEEFNVTGIDTVATANNYCNRSGIGGVGGGPTSNHFVDDYYVISHTGSEPTSPVFDAEVHLPRPVGAGSSTQFTPSTGANWENVDDTVADDDSTYNHSATAGNIDLFTMSDVAVAAATVHGIRVVNRMRKDDAGTRTVKNVIRTGGTNYEGAAATMSESYTQPTDIWTINPNTGLPWTLSEINALEAGYKLES